ncbi:MAG TPA: SOS response-associated peptidase family protein [Candidatus Acidoferrales bacterium]|nr:SOS response-associated peptidase family protein [Candidatus Acidoferrales bacterium]
MADQNESNKNRRLAAKLLTHSERALAKQFQAANEIDNAPRYNIAPTQPVLTVRHEHGKKVRHFTMMRWGLTPRWAKDTTIGTRTLNARSETVAKTPAFRVQS